MKKILRAVGIVSIVLSAFSACKKDSVEPGVQYDAAGQLAIDEEKIKAYIADSIPAIRHSTGLYYVISNPGAGEAVSNSANVTVKYNLRIMNGAVVPQSTDPITFSLASNLIAGWKIGVPLIRKGGKIRLIIPSGYGYGPYAKGSVPANSILDFNIELLDVQN